ncbi:hypothetical protein ACJMK2_043213 [Sinanodonta woodiana]|uniref:YEATS domain-containing protein n=1 Tax=Sinanodonta woodiana TaxID=1069815 RepID=A0ABD3VW76_SINWO
MQCVQVKIELGHRASLRAKPTKEGFTHDWTVYVRAPEGFNIAHFVEKVVFHLHDTFANPHRVVKKLPYHVSEAGYADFDLPIYIYFRNNGDPQKIKFNYNLFLQAHEPVNHVRCEKLTFQNPTDEFKKKLIKARGECSNKSTFNYCRCLCYPLEKLSLQIYLSHLKTESPKKQKQPSTISSKVTSASTALKIDSIIMDHYAVSTSLSSSSSSSTSKEKVQKIQIYPKRCQLHLLCHPRKKHMYLSFPNENNQTKVRRSSSVSSEWVRGEDKQKQKTDTSKQKLSKSSKKKNKESNLKDDDKKEGKNDKKEIRNDKKDLKEDKKEHNEDKMELKEDKRELKDDKRELKNDKRELKDDKMELKEDKRELKEDKKTDQDKNGSKDDRKEVKEIKDDRKELKEDKKKLKEVRDGKKEGKEVREDKKDVKVEKSSRLPESRKQDNKRKLDIKSSAKGENDKKDKSSNRNMNTEITIVARKSKSEHRKRSGSLDLSSAKNSPLAESGKVSPALSCKSNSEKSSIVTFENSSKIKKPTKDNEEKSSTKSVPEKKSESPNISDMKIKTQNCDQSPKKAPSPVTKSKKDENKS